MRPKLIIILLILTGILVYKENMLEKPLVLPKEGCISCHKEVSDPDRSHPISAFGCQSCHQGNPYSLDKKRAHLTMVNNPGDLSVVATTCGRRGCHSEIADRVRNSVMATNKGILNKLQYHWEKLEESTADVETLLTSDVRENLAIDNYAKMCGGCHLWKKKRDFPGEIGKRGGGCSGCHVLDRAEKMPEDLTKFTHSKITTRIPSENCVKCHNRSARIGLSYFGKFESAGYGTPYEGRGFNHRRLSGNRFFINLPADVHHTKANMECIDCHTRTGVMGDGNRYEYMKDQLDITCEACHQPRFSRIVKDDSLAQKLSFLNKVIPDAKGVEVAFSKKGTPIYNLRRIQGKAVFYRKLDGKSIETDIPLKPKAYHTLSGHDRLACQACHSAWIPQCYGCHFTYQKGSYQRDWLSKKASPGGWKEGRSYLRFSKPTLGVKDADKIAPFSPCQVFVSVFDKQGHYIAEESFKILAMASFDPHTTLKASRTCRDCHADPKSLGLGEGIFKLKTPGLSAIVHGARNIAERRHPAISTDDNGTPGEGIGCRREAMFLGPHGRPLQLSFRPDYDSLSSGLGITFPMDAFVDINGKPLQVSSSKDARPFNKEELEKIMSVNACLPCHNKYDDKIYKDFKLSLRQFKTEKDLPCIKAIGKYTQ